MTMPTFMRMLLAAALFAAVAPRPAHAVSASDKAEGSVVRLIIAGPKVSASGAPERLGYGGAFVVAEGGVAATVYFDAAYEKQKNDASVYVARAEPNAIHFYPAEVVGNNKALNLVLVHVPGLSLPPLKLNLAEVRSHTDVTAVRFESSLPDALSSTEKTELYKTLSKWVADGRRTSLPATPVLLKWAKPASIPGKAIELGKEKFGDSELPVIRHTVNITQGDCGTPLLNKSGHVIGLNPEISGCYSNSIAQLHDFLITSGYKNHPFTSSRFSGSWLLIVALGGGVLLVGGALALRTMQPPSSAFTPALPPAGPGGPAGPPGGYAGRVLPPISNLISRSLRRTVPPTVADRGGKGKGSIGRTPPPAERPGGRFELCPTDGGGRALSLERNQFAKQNGRLILGRSQDLAHILVDGRNISARHAAIRLRESRLYIEDLESSNGTRVNGKKLAPYTDEPISAGDTITLGSVNFRLKQA